MGALYSVARFIAAPFYKLLFPTKKLGYKEEKFDGPTVVICNHLSNFDAVTTTVSFKGQSYFLCKKELFKNKFFGFFIKKMGAVPIDRDKPELGEIKTAFKVLKNQRRLVIFPEGTRNKNNDGSLLPFKGGAGMFAFKTKARIIPMYINRKNKLFRKNYMYIGQPFTLEEFYGKKFDQELSEKISAKMAEEILNCKAKLEMELSQKKKNKKVKK